MMMFFSDGGRRPHFPWLFPLLYIALGIFLSLRPSLAGYLFCRLLALAAFVFAAMRLIRYLRERRQGWELTGDRTLAIVFACLGFFFLLFWRSILAFLPMTLGILLVIDGLIKLPATIDAFQIQLPSRIPLAISMLAPLLLGAIILINPFQATSVMIAFFGISLIIDGIFQCIAAFYDRSNR